MCKLVSVIVPCYNSMDCVFGAIDSILTQSYENIELIVCDDCSGNFDIERINNFILKNKHQNLKSFNVYSNDFNLGTVKNLNTAIKQSKGDYIVILSSDDWFYSNESISLICSRIENSETGMIVCRRQFVDQNKTKISLVPSDKQINVLEGTNFNSLNLGFVKGEFYEAASGSCIYYTRDFFNSVGGYDELFKLMEDWPFLEKVTRMIKFDLAYDIISINYTIGGVSGKKNPIICNDILNYYLRLKKERFHLYPLQVRRYVNFNIIKIKYGFFLASIIYPDVLFSKLRYRRKNNKLINER